MGGLWTGEGRPGEHARKSERAERMGGKKHLQENHMFLHLLRFQPTCGVDWLTSLLVFPFVYTLSGFWYTAKCFCTNEFCTFKFCTLKTLCDNYFCLRFGVANRRNHFQTIEIFRFNKCCVIDFLEH